MIRNERILHAIDTSSKYLGLELGPLSAPVLKKDEANIRYADHMTLEGLKEKYKNEPVVLSDIVAPDYVLADKTLKQAVGKQKFDYIIASHVIEHIPNTVAWLYELADILKPGGVVSLIIPDKRYTFDFNRRISEPADVIGAYYDQLERFSSAMMYDFASHCLPDLDTKKAWDDPEHIRKLKPRWSHKQVNEKLRHNLDPSDYVDCHCYVYTPASFVEILRALITERLLDFEVVYFLETQQYEIEFYVSLRKIDPKQTSTKQQVASLPVLSEYNKITELEEQVAVLQQEIHALTHSVSWRATKGLRAVRSMRKQKK